MHKVLANHLIKALWKLREIDIIHITISIFQSCFGE